jgi:hypothetical protein
VEADFAVIAGEYLHTCPLGKESDQVC